MYNLPFLGAHYSGGSAVVGGYGDGHGVWHDGGMMGWGWGLHGLPSLVLLVLVAVVLVVAVRWLWRTASSAGTTGQSAPSRSGGTALAILEERYARGEIDRDEFFTRKKDLTG
jgi:putative membrane protein